MLEPRVYTFCFVFISSLFFKLQYYLKLHGRKLWAEDWNQGEVESAAEYGAKGEENAYKKTKPPYEFRTPRKIWGR